MNLKISFILLFVLSNRLLAQTGEIIVFAPEDWERNEFRIQTFHSDSLVLEDLFQDSITIMHLTPGLYDLYIERNGDPYTHLYAIEVREAHRTIVDLPTDPIYIPIEEEPANSLSIAVDILYGPKAFSTSPFTNQSFEAKTQQAFLFPVSRTFLLGIQTGFDIRWSYFDRDTNVLNVPSIRREHYFAFNYIIGGMVRVFNYRMTDIARGPVLDLGVNYHLPLSFRHVYLQGNQKIITKKLHQYNDLTIFARLGYAPVTLTAEYCLFNYIRGNFGEMPRLKFGVSLVIAYDE